MDLNRIAQSLHYYAFPLVGNEHDTKDLLQDALLSVLTSGREPATEEEARLLLKSAIKWRAIDRARKLQRAKKVYEKVPHYYYQMPQAYDRLELKEVKEQLANLTDKKRAVLELHIEGYKNEEIARILKEKRENTVCQNLRYARQKIKALRN
jgi:RNA polymerase sigma factor (sigma-70 family)